MKRTILQGVRNVLFNSEWEVINVCISELGIFKLADIEMQLCNHCLEASNSQLHVCFSDIHLIVTMIADKEIVN